MDGVFAARRAVDALPDGASALACTKTHVFVATTHGAVHMYAVPEDGAWPPAHTQFVARRAVEQMEVVPGTPYTALLSDNYVWLWDGTEKPVRLPATKHARAVAAASWDEPERVQPRTRHPQRRASHAIGLRGMDELAADLRGGSVESGVHVSMLAVACRKHVVVYRWADGVFWDQKELGLPQPPQTLAILAGDALFVGCTMDDYVRIPLPPAGRSSVADLPQRSLHTGETAMVVGDWIDEAEWSVYAVTIPASMQPSNDTPRGWALMARRSKPLVLALDTAVLLGREQGGVLVDGAGRAQRTPQLAWDAPPKAIGTWRD